MQKTKSKNTVLITGGTGSLGQALTKRLLSLGHEVVIYSRDEYKQHKMAAEFSDPKLRFVVGDVRDTERVVECFRGVDYVIHAAALKHVPVGEGEPEEVIKTNVLGTMNIIKACKANSVKKAVFISTDKGCHPTNLYGATKMTGEKLFIGANRNSKTVFVCVRYGNVIGSRGSVIEYILDKHPLEIDVTDERMTRFWLSIDQAVDLVMFAMKAGKRGEIIIPKAKSSGIVEMFRWLDPNIKIRVTGIRAGEKLHESLISKDESRHALNLGRFYTIEPELFGVDYSDEEFEYTSENAPRFTKEEFMKLI